MTENEQFMKMYQPLHERFERFCKSRSYGSVSFEDLMHDSLIIAFDKLKNCTEPKVFLSFLFGTAIRVLANQRRKKQVIYVENYTEKINNSTVNDGEINLQKDELYFALAQLNSDTSDCIVLFEISGFSIKEIAEITKMKEATVKQRLVRGRKQLLTILNEENKKSS